VKILNRHSSNISAHFLWLHLPAATQQRTNTASEVGFMSGAKLACTKPAHAFQILERAC